MRGVAVEGEPRRLTTGVGMRTAVLSPDESKLIYSQGRMVANVWRVPILRDRRATWADAEQVTFDHAFTEFMDVSPGRMLVSSDRAGNQDLWSASEPGAAMHQITDHPTPDWCPVLSPDRQTIVFHSFRSGNRDLWLISAEGGAATRLTEHDDEDLFADWSPGGDTIAFASLRNGNYDIWTIAADGTRLRQVTSDPAQDVVPSWSPGGDTLYFTSLRNGGLPQVWSIPVGGGTPHRVTSGAGGGRVQWAADHAELYFIGLANRANDVWARSLENGDERPLTYLVGRRGEMGWTSLDTDGQFLYFSWQEELGDLWMMEVSRR